jgi:hypothetical protein
VGAADNPTAKVLFRVIEDDGSANVETLWAYELGDDKYRLDNFPLYAYAVSVGDVVYAPFDADEGRPTFKSVLEKSGNRTLRVIVDPPLEGGNASDMLMKRLVALGCGYEGMRCVLFAVNVPPETDFTAICELLTAENVKWEHADPTFEEVYPDDA